MVISLNAAVGFTVTSKHAHRDSCSTSSAYCAAAADEQVAEPENHRPFVVGDALAGLVAVALSAGDRQAGNRYRVAAKRVSLVLALEEQSREVRSTWRQPGNRRANPVLPTVDLPYSSNDLIIQNVRAILEGKESAKPVAPTPKIVSDSNGNLSDFSGKYKLGNSEFEIFVKGGQLYAGNYKLLPMGKDRFYNFWSYAEISFVRDEKGQVKGLEWRGSGGKSDWLDSKCSTDTFRNLKTFF